MEFQLIFIHLPEEVLRLYDGPMFIEKHGLESGVLGGSDLGPVRGHPQAQGAELLWVWLSPGWQESPASELL